MKLIFGLTLISMLSALEVDHNIISFYELRTYNIQNYPSTGINGKWIREQRNKNADR